MTRWTKVRHREAAERTLLTAIVQGLSPAALADALLAAATERAFADGGHALDFINKAFECLDLIGWEQASSVLPTVVGQMASARGAEESTEWRRPVDLVALHDEAAAQPPAAYASSRHASGWADHAALAWKLLGDDPVGITEAIKAALREGAAPADLGQSLSYGAALRVACTANEHADWETAHHVFTYANALCQMLGRIGIANIDRLAAARAVLRGAVALYLTRDLNVPPAHIPGEGGERLDDLPADEEAIRIALPDAFDRQRQFDRAARLVALYLQLGHSPKALIATLGQTLPPASGPASETLRNSGHARTARRMGTFDPERTFPIAPATEGMRQKAAQAATGAVRQDRPSREQAPHASVRPEAEVRAYRPAVGG